MQEKIKKVAIVVDDYKLKKYREELSNRGFWNLEIIPSIDNTTIIKIKATQKQIGDISTMCQYLEHYFKN